MTLNRVLRGAIRVQVPEVALDVTGAEELRAAFAVEAGGRRVVHVAG